MILVGVALAGPATDLAARVQQERIQSTLEVLTGEVPLGGEPVVSRNLKHADIHRVQAWLEAETGTEQEPFRAKRVDTANLILRIPGTNADLDPVLLGAHYDSTANLEDSYDPASDPAPGADDDASGVAVLMEAARVLGAWEGTFAHPVEIVWFSAEEEGLLGSIHHVEQRTQGVEVALILDPVGHNPGDSDVLFVAYDTQWPEAAGALEESSGVLGGPLDVLTVDHETFGGDDRSDHAPFWWAGLPALHAGTYPLPAAYHTQSDVLEGVDVEFVTEVARLTVAHAARLAGAKAPVEEDPGGCSTAPAAWGLWILALLGLHGLRENNPCPPPFSLGSFRPPSRCRRRSGRPGGSAGRIDGQQEHELRAGDGVRRQR